MTLQLPELRTWTSLALSGSIHMSLIALLLLEPGVRRSLREVVEVSYVSVAQKDKALSQALPVKRVAAPERQENLPLETVVPAADSSVIARVPTGSGQVDEYKSYLRQFLQARQRYPEMAQRLRQEGSVKVRFELASNGRVLSASLIEKSPYEILNRAAKSLIEEIREFKPFPETIHSVSQVFTVSIDYAM